MKAKFSDWWDAYLESDECKLKQTQWSFSDVGIIKEAMEDAFLHKEPLGEPCCESPGKEKCMQCQDLVPDHH